MAPIEQSETIHKLYDDQRVDELSFGTCGRFVNLHQAVLQAELPMTRSRLLAKLYADSQHPIVLHHAERVTLHPYFARWGEGDWLHVPMPLALITARMADMAMLLNEHGRDDFKVEKDKCEMYRWFARNRLPFAQVRAARLEPASFCTRPSADALPAFRRCSACGRRYRSFTQSYSRPGGRAPCSRATPLAGRFWSRRAT